MELAFNVYGSGAVRGAQIGRVLGELLERLSIYKHRPKACITHLPVISLQVVAAISPVVPSLICYLTPSGN